MQPAGFEGARGHAFPHELGPNNFQERPPGACRMHENLLATGLRPDPAGGELTELPMAGEEEADWAATSSNLGL